MDMKHDPLIVQTVRFIIVPAPPNTLWMLCPTVGLVSEWVGAFKLFGLAVDLLDMDRNN